MLFQVPYPNQQSTTSQAPHAAQNNKTHYLHKARPASPDKSLTESLTSANFNRNQRTTSSLEFHYFEHESHQIHRLSNTHHYRIISGGTEKAAELNRQFHDRQRALVCPLKFTGGCLLQESGTIIALKTHLLSFGRSWDLLLSHGLNQ